MNERTQELAEQAGWPKDTHQDDMYQVVGPDFAKKFAELIVRECALQCNQNDDMDRILEHFGVEE